MFGRRWVGVFWGFKAASLQGTVAAALEAVQNPGGLRSDLPFLSLAKKTEFFMVFRKMIKNTVFWPLIQYGKSH